MLKLVKRNEEMGSSLITVQDNTMLKHNFATQFILPGLITVQDNTMLKRYGMRVSKVHCLITVQDNTMLKPLPTAP